MGKKVHHHHWSQLPHFSLALMDPRHHPSITTYSPLQKLQFERKRSFLAWFIKEILAEPWHKFEKKGQKKLPPSLIRFAAFLPLADRSQASSKYNHLFPSSRASIWAQAQLSSSICLQDISRTMAPIEGKRAKLLYSGFMMFLGKVAGTLRG